MTGYEEPPAGVTSPKHAIQQGLQGPSDRHAAAAVGQRGGQPRPAAQDRGVPDLAAEGNLEERHRTAIKAILVLVISRCWPMPPAQGLGQRSLDHLKNEYDDRRRVAYMSAAVFFWGGVNGTRHCGITGSTIRWSAVRDWRRRAPPGRGSASPSRRVAATSAGAPATTA